ncbi:hypothetical protein GCM10027167_24520 [Nocardia heshunensis]
MQAATGAGFVPQREADPLTGIRPCRCGTYDEVYRTGTVATGFIIAVVSGQGQSESRSQESVGGDPGHMPAQEVWGEVSQIGPNPRRERAAMSACQGPQTDVDVETRCGTSPAPVTDGTPGSRGFDHGRRHGELPHAQPERNSGIHPVRKEHQRSPIANETPNPGSE